MSFSLLSSQSSYNLYSPYLELPTIGSGETMNFGFSLYANMPDSDGNNDTVTVVIDGITMSVPIYTDNRHYQAILDWVADGNTITAA